MAKLKGIFMILLSVVAIVAVAVGVFIFVKHNPNKVNTIDSTVKNAAQQAQTVVQEVEKKL